MSGLHKTFKTNSEKEVEGVKIEFSDAPNDDGSIPTFIISRMGKSNKVYSKALEQATRPYRRQIELQVLKNEIAESLFIGVFVNTILKGWLNVYDEEGQLIPFNRDNAIALLTELPDVYSRLQEEAQLSANFRDSVLETEAKN
jgi:hypothetical protein